MPKCARFMDGAQAIPHVPIDLQDFDCDFYMFSGHKFYGPNRNWCCCMENKLLLIQLPPYQGGGAMIAQRSQF